MDHAQLAALLRALAHLHPHPHPRPAGPPDLALVAALAALMGRSSGAQVRADHSDAGPAPLPVQTAPHVPVTAASLVLPALKLQSGAAARLPASAVSAGAHPNASDTGLVAQPSTLALLAGPADLATTRQGQVAGANTQPGGSEPAGPAAPLESLFAPGRVRAILRGLATLDTASGALDIAAAVALIARGEPIRVLPQRLISTLGHTVQLLFDAGPAMLPFSRDQSQLAASASRLLGRDRVRVADFIGDPGQGVRVQHQVRWAPLQWPGRRSAVLVVSDLGLGSGQAATLASAWQGFVDAAHQQGLRSVLLIPYPPARWPAVAHAFGTTLSWDLASGVQALRRSQRAGPGASAGLALVAAAAGAATGSGR